MKTRCEEPERMSCRALGRALGRARAQMPRRASLRARQPAARCLVEKSLVASQWHRATPGIPDLTANLQVTLRDSQYAMPAKLHVCQTPNSELAARIDGHRMHCILCESGSQLTKFAASSTACATLSNSARVQKTTSKVSSGSMANARDTITASSRNQTNRGVS
jgi:hypothetical protein